MKETTLNVQGMHCTSCEKLVKKTVEKLPGVKVQKADHAAGMVVVEIPDDSALPGVRSAIESLNFKVVS